MPPPIPNKNAVADRRILLVDDDAMWRFLTATALRERGFDVHDRDHAASIIDDLEAVNPDLLVIDALMPETDGFDALAQIRDSAHWKHLPVLMMTGLDDETAIARAYESGANDFFIKSTHWALLTERIRHLVRMSHMQQELLDSHAKLAIAQSAGRVGSFDLDFRGGILKGLPGSFLVLGFDENVTTLPIEHLRALFPEREGRQVEASLVKAVTEGMAWQVEVWTLPINRVPRLLQIQGELIRSGPGVPKVFRGLIRDITSTRQAEEELRRLASFDPLTGLPNRNRFLASCAQAIQAARQMGDRLAVLVIDLDRFTHVNETFGQVAGDDLLCQLARRLGNALGANENAQLTSSVPLAAPQEPLLGRLAGDDFAILLPRVKSAAEVDARIDTLQAVLKEPFTLGGQSCVISGSIGVASYPSDGDTAGLLLSRADVAIAAVKADGRSGGVHWYSPTVDRTGRVRLELANALHDALKRGELELHYQCIVDVAAGEVCGVEALMRWRRDGVLVPPAEFIPVAEQIGLIMPMGEWAIRDACRQLSQWQASGHDVSFVSVNLPSGHFERPSLPTLVQQALSDYALAPGSLELEITETGVMRDIERTLPRLDALRDAGVVLAIDDFGTGYSSLAYLSRLPVGKLKIDRAFVRELGTTRHADTIVRAIIALGHSLGMAVVAEGVETIEQAQALRNHGCTQMQGFLFAKPVGPDELPLAVQHAAESARALVGRRTPGIEPVATAPSEAGRPA